MVYIETLKKTCDSITRVYNIVFIYIIQSQIA